MIRIYILGMLAHSVDYPYNIRKKLLNAQPFIKISEGKFYYDFEALHKKNWIEPVQKLQEGSRPEKTLYRITSEGRRHLVEELYLCFQKYTEVADLYIAIHFLNYINKSEAASILKQTILKEKERWHTLKTKKAEKERHDTVSDSSQLIAAHAFEKAEFNIKWLERVLEFLK
ncbi:MULTISPECIES: PadR family transcriptional regulator [Cytobacillus]|uniref:PadR family transcriptional regulator n=1 Tax=Cytobacillus stercorigallinarum TaxID=2762240 RepID=A0ABR8QSF6_9BACI|nr:PadR family transcriptional regulator [Cytobacillus stercorigallinarum]MBD7938478.1 PadR family transcriptional regulator [Cytobacillus stercorigallinarum]